MKSEEAPLLYKMLNANIEAKAFASRQAFLILLQLIEQGLEKDVRPAVLRALQTLSDSASLSSDEEGDLRNLVANELQNYISDMNEQ